MLSFINIFDSKNYVDLCSYCNGSRCVGDSELYSDYIETTKLQN